jgi:single-stranded DNA-binding protein
VADYRTAVGFIQFPVDSREVVVNEEDVVVRDVTIRSAGGEGSLIRVTVWPELEEIELEEGDLIAVDGPFQVRDYQAGDGTPRQSLQISARRLTKL